jgi:hypothetical protein
MIADSLSQASAARIRLTLAASIALAARTCLATAVAHGLVVYTQWVDHY